MVLFSVVVDTGERKKNRRAKMGTKAEKKEKKGTANLTVVPATESTPKEGEIMTTSEKEQLRKNLADLKAKEKELKAEVKAARLKEKEAKAAAKAAGITNVFSRADATVEFIKSMGPSTLDEIIAGSNKVYFEHKGTEKSNNLKEAKSVANFAVHVLAGTGCLVLTGEKFSRK
jgi:hypothetical protein